MPDIGSDRHGDDEGSTPLVSVVLPVFNGEELVAAAVESALSQSGVEFEVVVVDDGSSDGTAEVLATFADHPRFRLIQLPHNKGLVHALNAGIEAAQGELIARLDADDVALPGRLAAQAEVFALDPAVVLTACAYERVLPSGKELRRPIPPLTHGALAMGAWSGNQLCHSAVMFRRRAALELGGYRPEWFLVEDYDLWLRFLDAGVYRGTTFVGTRCLVNPDGVSKQNETRQQTMADQRSDLFVASLLGFERPAQSSKRQTIRLLDDARNALHRRLTGEGIATEGIDAMAYRWALKTAGGRSRVLRHLCVLSTAPALWWNGRQSRSR